MSKAVEQNRRWMAKSVTKKMSQSENERREKDEMGKWRRTNLRGQVRVVYTCREGKSSRKTRREKGRERNNEKLKYACDEK